MTIKLTEQDFFGLIQDSHDRTERENKKYYYTVDDYKIDNAYLAAWHEQTFNTFNHFVSPVNVSKIKKVLEDKTIDLNHNYDLDYIKKLRNENDYLQLFLSGGVDSCSILVDCIENDILIDELVSVYTGDSIDLPENQEIKNSAIKYAEQYKGKYGKFTLHNSNREFLRNHYKEPFVFLKTPELGGQYPFLRQSYHTLEKAPGPRIHGPNKPQLLFYKNSCYVVCFDADFNGMNFIDQAIVMSHEPENIKTLIKTARIYRNYLLENNKIKENQTQFFKPSKDIPAEYYGRKSLMFANKDFSKGYDSAGNIMVWPEKDILALTDIIGNHDLELFLLYSNQISQLIESLPSFSFKDKEISHNKICWAIDIDSLEIFTQQELIPNGF